MLAITSGGNGRSEEKGLPGAKRIRKKEIVINTNKVGIASKILLAISLIIISTEFSLWQKAPHPTLGVVFIYYACCLFVSNDVHVFREEFIFSIVHRHATHMWVN